MSRIRVMVNGIPSWSENQPGYNATSKHGFRVSTVGGTYVVGEPGKVERDRQATKRCKARSKP